MLVHDKDHERQEEMRERRILTRENLQIKGQKHRSVIKNYQNQTL